MLSEEVLHDRLPIGGFGLPLYFLPTVGSTNDVAIGLAEDGAPEGTLVVADAQTRGRGRSGQAWQTPPGTALALSLVLRPRQVRTETAWEISVAGALAVADALETEGAAPSIKWPNDVLLDGRKFCGILAETVWVGGEAESIVLGIGVNVALGAVPQRGSLNFPATSLEAELQSTLDRVGLLHDILVRLLKWRPQIATPVFIHTWDAKLAFKGEPVQIRGESGNTVTGILEGLNSDGSLRVDTGQGPPVTVHFGEVHLRTGL